MADDSCNLLAIIDREYRYEFVSTAYAHRMGCPADALVGTYLLDGYQADEASALQSMVESAFAGREVCRRMELDFSGLEPRDVEVCLLPRPATNAADPGACLLLRELSGNGVKAPVSSEQPDFERLIADLSSRFAAIGSEDVDLELPAALERIGRFLEADRCFVFVLAEDGSEHRVAYLWQHEAVPEDPVVVGVVVQQGFPWVGAQMLNHQDIVVSCLQDLPGEAAQELQYCRHRGIQSFLICPMYSRSQVIGSVGLDCIASERVWSRQDVRRLRLLGEVLGSELVRRRNETEIRRLKTKLEEENVYLRGEIEHRLDLAGIVGESAAIKRVLDRVEKVAATNASVLILGETGTGKELFARSVHRSSQRKERPLIAVNCAALSPTLIESELFGREKGAYTGAYGKQIGRFELADGSTIFLDEIGDLPLDVQGKLLRVLDCGEFERLGSPETRRVDVRLIAATNRDLEQAVQDGTFRPDLFYRLSVFPVELPPLRDRREDIPLLVWAFVREFQATMGRKIDRISKPTMDALVQNPWMGNVRELRNAVERAMILSKDRELVMEFPSEPGNRDLTRGGATLAEIEREHILAVLDQTHWRVRGERGAASILGLKPSTLEFRMKKLGIRRP